MSRTKIVKEVNVRSVNKRVVGKLLESNGRFALLLQHPNPDRAASGLVYLRFAFVTQGKERHIFPKFLLDDWGREVRLLKTFAWVQKNGAQFPRAEIFGQQTDGTHIQLFVRELELFAKFPCYFFPAQDTPVDEGRLLKTILIPNPTTTIPEQIYSAKELCWFGEDGKGARLKRPLSRARVNWWYVPPNTEALDFLTSREPETGY